MVPAGSGGNIHVRPHAPSRLSAHRRCVRRYRLGLQHPSIGMAAFPPASCDPVMDPVDFPVQPQTDPGRSQLAVGSCAHPERHIFLQQRLHPDRAVQFYLCRFFQHRLSWAGKGVGWCKVASVDGHPRALPRCRSAARARCDGADGRDR